jgi:hypothetical protein
MHTPTGQQTGARLAPPPPFQPPMRVSFNGDLLEVSAILADAEAVDRLVKALQANKALLPEKKPKDDDEAANWGGLIARYHKYFAASAIRMIATMANAPICTQRLLTKPPLLLVCTSIAGSSLDGRPASQSPRTFPVVGLTKWIRAQTGQVKDRKVPSSSAVAATAKRGQYP